MNISDRKPGKIDRLSRFRQALASTTGYFYAPDIDAYIHEHRQNQNRILELSGGEPLPQALTLIHEQRAQLLLEDSEVMAWVTTGKREWFRPTECSTTARRDHQSAPGLHS